MGAKAINNKSSLLNDTGCPQSITSPIHTQRRANANFANLPRAYWQVYCMKHESSMKRQELSESVAWKCFTSLSQILS